MLSIPYQGPGDLRRDNWRLDARYGFAERCGYRRDTAEDMAYMDNLIEAAFIKLGDSIEVLYVGPHRQQKEPEWEYWGEFCGVENGALLIFHLGPNSRKPSECSKGHLRRWIKAVRKKTWEK